MGERRTQARADREQQRVVGDRGSGLGVHDARIGAFFAARGEPAMLEDPAASIVVIEAPMESPVAPVAAAAPVAPVAAVAPMDVTITAAPVPAVRPMITPKPVIVVPPATARRPSVVLSNPTAGVVVRRNVVINVGAGQPPVHGTIGKPNPLPAWPARARAGGHYAVRDGAGYVAGNRARAAVPAPEAQPQPLASARDIRMPWETPAPTRIAPAPQTVVQTVAADGSTVSTSGKIRMPWDVPGQSATEAFSAELVSDKSLDEVILEYLADDGETDER